VLRCIVTPRLKELTNSPVDKYTAPCGLTCNVEIGLSFRRRADAVGGAALVPATVVLVDTRYHQRAVSRHLTSDLSYATSHISPRSKSLITSSPRQRGAKRCDQSACMSVCLSVHLHISKTTRPNFTEFSAHATCGHGSVVLWRQRNIMIYDMYFRFVNDIMCSHNRTGHNQRRRVCFVQFAKWRHRGRSLPYPTASRFNKYAINLLTVFIHTASWSSNCVTVGV